MDKTEEDVLQGMDYVEFITRCKIDFKFFCERLLGITDYGGIHPFQMEWFYLIQNNKVSVIEAPSGSSKTEIVGVAYTLFYLLNNPKSKVLLVSKTIQQAETNLLERIKTYINSNPIMQGLFKPEKEETWNRKQIKLADGSLISNVPYNLNIRSYRANLIICDEADSYEDTDIYFSEVTSRLIPGGKICIISTPKGTTRLIGQLKARKPQGYSFLKTCMLVDKKGKPAHPPYIEKEIKSIWPERFTVKYLLEELNAIGENAFELNYQCNVIEGEDAIFSLKTISNCFDKNLTFNTNLNKDAQYIISADFAISKGPKADSDAFIVLEKLNKIITVKHIETHKGKPLPFKVNRLVELYEKYQNGRTVRIIADESNMGSMVIRELRSRGCTVVAQKFYWQDRKNMLLTLSNVFESDKGIIIPFSDEDREAIKYVEELIKQAIGFKRKTSESGNEIILSTSAHDDILISLAMGVKFLTKTNNSGKSLIMSSK